MHHHLLINVAVGRLFEPSDPLPPGGSLPTALAPDSQEFPLQANLLSTPQAIQDLLHEFSDVVYSDKQASAKPCHDVRHHILTNPGPPVFAKTRRLDPEKLASAHANFSTMESYDGFFSERLTPPSPDSPDLFLITPVLLQPNLYSRLY